MDARRLFQDKQINRPCAEYKELVESGDRNVGRKSALYRHKGLYVHVLNSRTVKNLIVTMYKVGRPQDKLVFYIYKYQTQGLLPWPGGISREVDAKILTTDHQGENVTFSFDPPVGFTLGDYQFVIFRTGRLSDTDYYRVYTDSYERLEYIHAALEGEFKI